MTTNYKIAVFAGDGIGPEVTQEALRVLDVTAELAGFSVDYKHFPHGSEHYLATGELLPDDVLEEVRGMDAVYLGAIGDPRVEVGLVERGVIAGLRFGLDLYANVPPLRPGHTAAVCRPPRHRSPSDRRRAGDALGGALAADGTREPRALPAKRAGRRVGHWNSVSGRATEI